jgi:predicted adenine nucleotide alpha hydrolase (AANH) superfamily ATPase
MSFRPSLLLHISHPTELLKDINILLEEFDVTLLFYQPSPRDGESIVADEAGVKKAAELLRTSLLAEPKESYNKHHHSWHDDMEVCQRCYKEALAQTASLAENNGFDFYTSLLTMDESILTRAEEEHTGVGTSQFLSLDDKL